ncbi:H+/Cl-antiporter ClcA [Desulfocicer vacuolatum DSM 3385]|uniref:H+/Cl-antiporter ClcA n=1 Tax=Desulfocicer vacuolatum DSM 3385 TaxID=1121400 RepID=A0A1W2ELT4_9BACT|nr:voltage-gated chloride channel family protein [Desulfocicer vacuolatum]SMD10256.1 H+/Cl-antiporter ClcA [Desulfocicer vacuolatum DSM 3385]
MSLRWDTSEHIVLGRFVVKWLFITAVLGAAVGSAVAFFLWLLHQATVIRWQLPWLVYFLPLAGIAIVVVYAKWGKNSAGGNNLVMEQIHEPGGGIPKRMSPLVLFATVATHLFGGSAGREGTAVQMGGSIAQALGDLFKLNKPDTRIFLTCGIAAGFGAVFGTPLTGAIFALEVLTLGRMRYEALIPCLMASMFGDLACSMWGIHHTHYSIIAAALHLDDAVAKITPLISGKVALASIFFGLAGYLFAELTHTLSHLFTKYVPTYWVRPIIGSALVLGISYLLGTRDYLGIGVLTADGTGASIVNAFKGDGITAWSWFWKLLLTAITLSSGFKGGEVTPLFFVGATLGAALASLFGLPVDLMAGLGFIGVFAGATNTPLACTIMGVELFGAQCLPYFSITCFFAYLFSGHSGIYLSQKMESAKCQDIKCSYSSLRAARENKRPLHLIFQRRNGCK